MTLCSPTEFDAGEGVRALAARAEQAGGRAILVGGWVRDALLGRASKDIDVELHGFGEASTSALLGGEGAEVRRIHVVGRSFPMHVLQLRDGTSLDVSVAEARGPIGESTAEALHARAARRRDLRINSMGFDPLTGELLDPFQGRADLEAKALRCVDAERFTEDPLRILRVARFAAQLGFEPDEELMGLCRASSLREIAVERIYAEWERFLLAADPAKGLTVLSQTGVRAEFAALEALVDVPQDARWHPEGCVWTHTVMVVREAAALRRGEDRERDLRLMWGVLCHDLGKPSTTTVEADAIRSRAHDAEGEVIARNWLSALQAPAKRVEAVATLVRWHLAPALLTGQESTDRAYRRLSRRLAEGGVDADLLWRVARADHLGRTTPEALAGDFAAGDAFRLRMENLGIQRSAPAEFVRGRDVLAAGIAAGPEVGRVLDRCRDIQDETGSNDGAEILERALRELPSEGGN